MKRLFAIASLFSLLVGTAAAWAILLGSPELWVPAGVDRAKATEVEKLLAKLDFDGGVIHVGSGSRNLRFKSPGQDLIKFVPALKDAGFEVRVFYSDKLQKHVGGFLTQNEGGEAVIGMTINTAHPKLTLEPKA